MKHIQDIKLSNGCDLSIYETENSIVIDYKDNNGELIEGTILDKD